MIDSGSLRNGVHAVLDWALVPAQGAWIVSGQAQKGQIVTRRPTSSISTPENPTQTVTATSEDGTQTSNSEFVTDRALHPANREPAT